MVTYFKHLNSKKDCQDAMAIEGAVVPLLKTEGYRIPSGSATAGISASLCKSSQTPQLAAQALQKVVGSPY